MKPLTFICDDCRFRYPVNHVGGTGYAIVDGGAKVCYGCCGGIDLAAMKVSGKATLYLTIVNDTFLPGRPMAIVGNWPGTMKFPVYRVRKGRHNIARVRYDLVTTEYMSTDIGPKCAKCGETLYHYRVTAGKCYSDVRAICATCHKVNWFDASSRLDNVSDVRRHHIALNDDGSIS